MPMKFFIVKPGRLLKLNAFAHPMRMKTTSLSQIIIFAILICTSCSNKGKLYPSDTFPQYKGVYEYLNSSTIIITPSDFDSTLYAILDDAKYPLRYVKNDTFMNSTNDLVIFKRDDKNEVRAFEVGGDVFELIRKDTTTREWFPRKESSDRYKYAVPPSSNDGLETGGIDEAFTHPELLEEMVRETIKGTYADVHSILIYKDGKLVLEEYFYEYDINKPHQLRSASKSFIGTLVGISIDQRTIGSETDRLMPYFSKKYPTIVGNDERKSALTIKDFLTYRHGMDCNDENPETAGHELKMIKNPDWVKFTLDLPMIEVPGKRSSYCTGCAQTLGSLVELVNNQPIEEFAKKNLFSPLGIDNYQWRFDPDTSSQLTFNQMYLRPRDILKLAKIYLDKGIWKGKQIVSKEWIEKTFTKDDIEFGYLWRHKSFDVDGKTYRSFLATGNGGQKINIWPDQNMITVFTGGNYNSFLAGKPTPPNEMIPLYILKAL
jgi:CubicO group peptidase (beta-lactamase class C family)